MTRPLWIPRGALIACLTVAMALAAPKVWADVVGLTSGVTVAADPFLTLTGVTVPNGKSFANLANAEFTEIGRNDARTRGTGCRAMTALTCDDGLGLPDSTSTTGVGDQRFNVFLIANGFGYIDMLLFDGHETIVAADGDATQQDFFLAELGGNDNFQVAPILFNGDVGQNTLIFSGDFGQQPGLNGNFDAQPAGLVAFDITDLLGPDGQPLSVDTAIRGVRVYENQNGGNNGLDLFVFAADVVYGVPEPSTVVLLALSMTGLVGRRR